MEFYNSQTRFNSYPSIKKIPWQVHIYQTNIVLYGTFKNARQVFHAIKLQKSWFINKAINSVFFLFFSKIQEICGIFFLLLKDGKEQRDTRRKILMVYFPGSKGGTSYFFLKEWYRPIIMDCTLLYSGSFHRLFNSWGSFSRSNSSHCLIS